MSITTATATSAGNIVYISTGNTAITWLSLNNWGPSNVTANLFVVPSTDLPGTPNQVYYSLLLASGDTYQIYAANEKLLLDDGDFVQVDCTGNIAVVTSYTSV